MTDADRVGPGDRVLVVGYGLHGQALAAALARREIPTAVVDDRPSDATCSHARAAGVDLVVAPGLDQLRELVIASTHVLPTPGLPDDHPVFAAARAADVAVIGEFDLARQWDQRPVVAITGTNGKTTVTTLVTDMLCRSDLAAVAAGNMEIPLAVAIDDPTPEIFVVEASSFRLGHARTFAPRVATWLNFHPDHLDVHASLATYEAAKARIWSALPIDGVAVANVDDPTVMRNIPEDRTVVTFGAASGNACVREGHLVVDGALMPVSDLPRALPHDIANALAAAATALAAGATREGVVAALGTFRGLPHRVQLVAEVDGVRWYDDSKATTPHAVIAGVGGFESVVLIAGGRNKGVDLGPLRALAPRLRAVVAIGEAADEVAAVFADVTPVIAAPTMEHAVGSAAALARPGDAVVLSPACTSYDWYANYGERGDDFARLVRALEESP